MKNVLKKIKFPLLKEFAEWCIKDGIYDENEALLLLTEKWNGAYPEALLGDDLLVDIQNFCFNIGAFALEKAKKSAGYDESREGYLFTTVHPSYDDESEILIYNRETRTLVAEAGWKTWNTNPEKLEGELEDLIEEIKKGIELVRKRREVS